MSKICNLRKFLSLSIVLLIASFLATGHMKAKVKELKQLDKGLQAKYLIQQEQAKQIKARQKLDKKLPILLAKFQSRMGESAKDMTKVILNLSAKYGLDPILVLAVIKTESDFHQDATSGKGAVGLMQLLPPTAEDIARRAKVEYQNASSLRNSMDNVRLGTYYLHNLIKQYGDTRLALEAYNRGATGLNRALESGHITYSYSDKVMESISHYTSRLANM